MLIRSTQFKLLFAMMMLIMAQLLLLVHQVDINAHTLAENCEICLQGGNLANTHTVAVAPSIFVPSLSDTYVVLNVAPYLALHAPIYLARAPPALMG